MAGDFEPIFHELPGCDVVQELVSLTATSWLEYGGYGAAAMYLPKATANPQHVVLPFNKCNNTKLRVRVVW